MKFFALMNHCIVALAVAGAISLAGCADQPDTTSTDAGATAGSGQAANSDAAAPEGSNDSTSSSSDMPAETQVARADAPKFDDPGSKDPVFDDPASPKLPPLVIPDEPAARSTKWHEAWVTNFELAKVQAAKEGKDLLVDFTGSDWCGWCIRLVEEVFSQPGFGEEVTKKFVLVELDFPQDDSGQSAELKAQNQELQSRFGIRGFPTILLMDAQGRPYASTGYQAGGPQEYLKHLDELQAIRAERDTLFAAAAKAQGIERAKVLDTALQTIPPQYLLPAYEKEVDEIVTLDADGKAELRSQYEEQISAFRFSSAFSSVAELAENPDTPADEALAAIDKAAVGFTAPRQVYMFNLARLEVLHRNEMVDPLQALVGEMLKSEDLDEDDRFGLHARQLTALGEAGRYEDALKVIDQALAGFKDQENMSINLLLARANFLVKLNRKEEAKVACEDARKLAPPQVRPQIDAFVQDLLADKPEAGSAEPADPAAPEAKPATDQ